MRLESYSFQHYHRNLLCELVIFAQQLLFLSIFQYSDKTRNSPSNRHVKDQNEVIFSIEKV